MKRRTYITITGGTLTGLAGCTGSGSNNSDGEPSQTTDDSADNSSGEQPETADGGESDSTTVNWLYPEHDLQNSGYVPNVSGFDEEPVIAWRSKDDDYLSSQVTSIIVNDSTVYAAWNGVRSFESTGTERWAKSYTAESNLALVDGDLVFVNENGRIFRLNPETGKRVDAVAADIPNPKSALVTSDGIYARRGRNSITLRKYDLETGEQQWQFPSGDPVTNIVGPVFTDESMVVGAVGDIVALDPATGEEEWRVKSKNWSTYSSEGRLTLHSLTTHDGVIYVDGGKYVSAEGGNLDSIVSINADDGSFQQHYETTGRLAAIDDETVYVIEDDLLTGVDLNSGESRVEYVASGLINDVTVTSDTAYLYERVVASNSNRFTAVSTADGSERFSTTYSLSGSYTDRDHIVATDETVYLAADKVMALRSQNESDES